MSTKPNYFKLGLFILIALFLLIAAIILFGSGVFAKKKTLFETYFADPVTGLAQGSPILEQGVKIGSVESISFVRHDYPLPEVIDPSSPYRPLVRVICSVEGGRIPELETEDDPETKKKKYQVHLDDLIKNGLRLQLSTNILTGQAYIESGYLNPERFPVEPYPWTPEHLFIPSAPSSFTTMKDSVDNILHSLEQINTEEIADNVNQVLETVNQAVKDAEIGKLRAEIVEFISDLRQTNQDLKKLLESPTPEQDIGNIAELVDQMNRTLIHIDQLVLSKSPQVTEMLENFKQMSENLKNMTEDLKKDPAELIFSQPPEKKEMLK